jgi:hypothetical protein
MRRGTRAIVDVLFPVVRSRVLSVLFAKPTKARYLREVMRITRLTLSTVQDEMAKLVVLGVVKTWSNGYRRFYVANRSHQLFGSLAHIVEASARSAPVNVRQLPRQRRLKRKPKRAHLRPSHEPNWGLFKKPRQPRR